MGMQPNEAMFVFPHTIVFQDSLLLYIDNVLVVYNLDEYVHHRLLCKKKALVCLKIEEKKYLFTF